MALGYVAQMGYKEATVLDAACGCGYGSIILAQSAAQVIGMDINRQAIGRAQRRYTHPDVEYIRCDLNAISKLPPVDVAVSFETIEHLAGDPAQFVRLLQGCARYLIILSTPVIPTTHKNKYHKHDFTEKDITGMLLTEQWKLWEKIRQGPYLVIVAYNAHTGIDRTLRAIYDNAGT